MATSDIQATKMDSILDTVKSLIPSNPVKAFAEGNMLQVLVFSLVIGFTLIAIGEKGEPLLKVIDSLNEVCLKIISTVMYFTPIGVFCTIVPVVEANGTSTIVSLATQLVILYIAFFGFALVVYGAAVKVLGKTSPIRFFRAIMPAALNAFGTCSSSATIPLSKQCVEDELGVSNQVSSITIPLGATVNMDAVSILMSFKYQHFDDGTCTLSKCTPIRRNAGNPRWSDCILCGSCDNGRTSSRSHGRVYQYQYVM